MNKGFKRSIYWNKFNVKPKIRHTIAVDNNNNPGNPNINKLLESNFQGVNRLFVLPFTTDANNVEDSNKRYYFPKATINNFNVEIGGKNFYDRSINDKFRKFNELRKVCIGNGDDYSTGSLLDFKYFSDYYKIIAIDLSRQKILGAVRRANQQIVFTGTASENMDIYYVLEQSKETILEFSEEIAKVL